MCVENALDGRRLFGMQVCAAQQHDRTAPASRDELHHRTDARFVWVEIDELLFETFGERAQRRVIGARSLRARSRRRLEADRDAVPRVQRRVSTNERHRAASDLDADLRIRRLFIERERWCKAPT